MRVVGWLVGAPLAIFRFLRREVAIVEIDPARPQDPLPPEDHEAAQQEAGVGPVIHRLYSATIREPKLTAGRLLDVIAADPNVIAPSEVLRFERTRGEPGPLLEGDEVLIRMAGPWNAPVTVIRRWEEGIRLAARAGHPQLGQVEVRARDDDDDIVLQIRTRERAAGVGFHALQRIGLIRRMQSYTWAEMLENAAQLAGGRQPEQIAVRSWRDDPRSKVPRSLPRVATADTKGVRMTATVEQTIEVQVPIETAYNQWTQFEEYPKFMEGVEQVEQLDDRRLHWVAEFGGQRHEWDAEIVEQHPEERVAWRNTDGKENAGVVTFHKIDDGTTRVAVQMDFVPEGLKEKVGDALGVPDRRVKGDLGRFKEFIESRGQESGGWRGEVPREA